jgi:uncharacterized membrane protein YgaE (UPF0421/DUF939 family)
MGTTQGLRLRLQSRPTAELLRSGRDFGVRTAKITLAAVLSYVVAERLRTSPAPVLAPLTALLVVQLTMYETVEHGLERVLSVVSGVLVAFAVAHFVGLTWWSLGAVIAVSLVVGELVRLGPHLIEVPITAMLVLSVSGVEQAALGRVYETLVGAAIGILVNAVIAPPLYVRPASEAIGDLAYRMASFLRGLAAQLRAGWSRDAAERWLNEARALATEVQRADQQVARAEQSARLNPRGAIAREAQPRLRTTLTALEHCYVSLRHLTRALYDHTAMACGGDERRAEAEAEAEAYGREARALLADVLEAAADALGNVVTIACGRGPAGAARERVEADLSRLHQLRHRLSAMLLVDPRTDQGAWQQHGALLAAGALAVPARGGTAAAGGPPHHGRRGPGRRRVPPGPLEPAHAAEPAGPGRPSPSLVPPSGRPAAPRLTVICLRPRSALR